ncbi:hypothetical protein M2436_000279 [Streptomyces sp. HB372]|nr:hypothetical protein [Streptomyces sp. HB372]
MRSSPLAEAAALQHPEAHHDGDQLLLSAVVQITFDASALEFEGRCQRGPAGAEFLQFRQQIRVPAS